MNTAQVGSWAFIIGVILSVLVGFIAIPNLAFVLLILGLVVGFMNVTVKETTPYLVAVIALLVIGVASVSALEILGAVIVSWVQTVLGNFITFVAASGLIVALKEVVVSASKE